jgi:predicted RNA-binding protein (virulence factor B family)
VKLPIARFGAPGAFLSVGFDENGDENGDENEDQVLLLPSREVPRDAREGDIVSVFVYLDSDDRPIATTRTPRLALGEVTFLEITSVTRIGAFADWGLGKELLIPFAEQTKELYVGEWQPIGLYLDHSGRLAGTMRIADLLARRPRRVVLDEWIEGEAWRNDPDIGLFAILERSYIGLVPASEPHRLRRGDQAKFRVANILPDGKLVLSLRQHAYKELEADAATILSVLSRPGAPRVGDHSSPDTIRDVFGLSKKAFKRAVGRLLKERAVVIDERGFVVVAPTAAPR